jgi:hypothetical protein
MTMKFDRSFFKNILYVILGSVIISAYPLYAMASKEIVIAVLAGALLSTINIMLGYISIEMAYERSMTKFMKWILGGMGIRLLFLLAALFFVIKVLQFHLLAFIISLFGFYTVYLILEILHIDKKVREKTL